MTISIKDLPKSERPRERLARYGTEKLSVQELLAILVSSGSSRNHDVARIVNNLLNAFEGNLKDLFSASIEELLMVEGIGFAKACQIKAVFELGKRIASYCKDDRKLITTTEDVVLLVLPHMMYLKHEEFRVVLLDSKNKVIREHTVSMGSLDRAFAHPREVFRPAVAAAAASLILVHNHPSGDPTPSEQDILLTRELCMCGTVLDIEVLDHIIIGASNYVSMKLRELM